MLNDYLAANPPKKRRRMPSKYDVLPLESGFPHPGEKLGKTLVDVRAPRPQASGMDLHVIRNLQLKVQCFQRDESRKNDNDEVNVAIPPSCYDRFLEKERRKAEAKYFSSMTSSRLRLTKKIRKQGKSLMQVLKQKVKDSKLGKTPGQGQTQRDFTRGYHRKACPFLIKKKKEPVVKKVPKSKIEVRKCFGCGATLGLSAVKCDRCGKIYTPE
jgi:ribosomal protein L40E